MERIIFHIDVNSAYLSWTALEELSKGSDTDLRGIPSIIGGAREKRHGVVLAKSIPAKAFGIHTGEPVVSALRKCPNLVIAPPDHSLYSRRSRELMGYLNGICPDIEQVSVDECYMDYTPVSSRYPSPEEAAALIKDEIRSRFGYTVNIGISDRKVLAKMASDFRKPDLVHTLYHNEIREKMWPLPVSSLYMCGASSQEVFRKLEIPTIGDLAAADPSILTAHLKSHGLLLWQYANGIDDTPVQTEDTEAKGIGNSTTLAKDVSDRAEASTVLLSLSESVSSRLREAGQMAGMVSVEIKYASFRTASHQTTMDTPTDLCGVIHRTSLELFDALWDRSPIRLLGIRTSKLVPAGDPIQLSLFDYASDPASPSMEKQRNLENALDSIRQKYGSDAVVRGSLMNREK